MTSDAYLPSEGRARMEIDRQLACCGWLVQSRSQMNLYAGQGVAVREFIMAPGHGRADYLLFVDGKAVGAIEAKSSGTPLAGVEPQSATYAAGLPSDLTAPASPLPFLYESTGEETMFTDGFDPEPCSRLLVTFHRPETLARWLRHWLDDADGGSLRARLPRLEPVRPEGLRRIQVEAISAVEASMIRNRPRALAQMATGSGKTFMAANLAYRLVQSAGAERVLFLADRANLGRRHYGNSSSSPRRGTVASSPTSTTSSGSPQTGSIPPPAWLSPPSNACTRCYAAKRSYRRTSTSSRVRRSNLPARLR